MTTTEPTLRYQVGSIVVPGDRLGRTVSGTGATRLQLLPGPGTYSRGGQLFASITGSLQTTSAVQPVASNTPSDDKSDLPTVTISVMPRGGADGFRATQQVLRQGQIVLAQVVRIATQQVMADIFATEHGLLQYDHRPAGVIRREDIRSGVTAAAPEPQSVTNAVLTQHFCPGDWIVARILSLGDARRYFLSTAEAGLGVIYATSSVSGQPMIPVSWKEMECPETGTKEARKCARPAKIPDTLFFAAQQQQQQQQQQHPLPVRSSFSPAIERGSPNWLVQRSSVALQSTRETL